VEAGSPVDFDHNVIPILTKSGCNSGACHGAAVGRGGFKLSLYGGDPQADYQSIVLELEGRRVNLARPDESLVVMKATESIEHGGGYRLDPDAAGTERLLDWIKAGSPRRASKNAKGRRLERLEITPATHVAAGLHETFQLIARAHFSDGSIRDVTPWTVFTPEDPSAVKVDSESAEASILRRGRHIVVARYLSQVVPIEILLPLSDDAVDLTSEPRESFIDDRVLALLSTLRIPTSPPADDATFLRRVTLDLTGRLPTPEATGRFMNDSRQEKREQLVGGLLESDEFNEYWTLRLAKLLRIRSQPQDQQGALAYHRWLRKQIAKGIGYDRLAHEILTATGDTHQVGPANFYRTVSGAREQAELASELLMGCRLRCANCHNHPFDRWTQDDYHGLAAIFAKVQPGRVVRVNMRGAVTHRRTGENAVPRIPGGRFLDPDTDARASLAGWLTDRNNPYFATAFVNRLWKAMMGRGLVEPADDLRATNPASHPLLLDQLATDFVEHGFDLRHSLRRIALSATYARGAEATSANAADDRFYSHALRKPLEPEVLADAISDVLRVPDQYGDEPLGTRAVALFDSKIPSESLDILGRCSREDSCESSSASTGGLPRKLHLLNGPLLNRRIVNPSGRMAKLIVAEQPPMAIIEEFYTVALGRNPSAREQDFWEGQVKQNAGSGEQRELLEDFVWSLLTCAEFVNNH
jgi:hypothetical protein